MSLAYYNENDPYAAQWLRNLIDDGQLPYGDVDERDIRLVRGADLRLYRHCHFFAGVGGWAVGLGLAGWPADREVWTGSCPCQPFSTAGKRKGFADERHLWPEWLRLIRERRPATILGEQVGAAIGGGWLDAVLADLEGEDYACGAAVLPACSVGAPHIRQRLWFVADAGCGRGYEGRRLPAENGVVEDGARRRVWREPGDGSAGSMVDTPSEQVGLPRRAREPRAAAGELGNPGRPRLQEQRGIGSLPPGEGRTDAREAPERAGPPTFWAGCDWVPCMDGKARPVEPGLHPLAHGVQRRTSKLRAYGNAIVPQGAAAFVVAAMDALA